MLLEDVVAALGAIVDDSILITDAAPLDAPGPTILWCNDALLRQTGYARDELIGRNPRIFQGPQTDAAATARIGAALRAGQGSRCDLLNYRKDGSTFWTDLSIIPAPGAGGPRFFVAVQRDASARKAEEAGRRAALEALQRAAAHEAEVTAQLDGLGRHAPGALYQSRVERDGRRRMTYWSATLPGLFGVDPTAVSVGAVLATVHPADLPGLRQAMLAADAADAVFDHAYRVRHREKGLRWLRSVAAPRRAPDGARIWDGHVLDITEHRTALAELAAARERAEAASEAKSRFLARMSHELRTPLNAILGLAALMDRDGLPPAQADRLRMVRAAGGALLGLLGDLLDAAELEQAEVPLAAAPFSLAALGRRLDAAHGPAAAAKGLGFGVRVLAAPGAMRVGDAAEVERIADRLIENAIRFTEAGAVAVRLIDGDEADPALRIEVEDDGPGVAAEDLPRLFAAFGQAEDGPTRRHGGAGLGLTLADRLARAMGGAVTVDSAPGHGALFRVTLPLPRPEPAPRAPLSGLRVLVVEDQDGTRAQIETMLVAAGCAVATAANGRAALAAHAAERFDVVLLDIAMPGIDGFETLRRLRAADAARGLPPTPVLAVTASAMAHELRVQEAAGFDGHAPKPVDAAALTAEIARVAARAGAGRPLTA